MTSGERRLAERLEQKLDDDYLMWYDVPVGPMRTHPDFVIIHPRRGILVLEPRSESRRATARPPVVAKPLRVANETPATRIRGCRIEAGGRSGC